MNPNPQRADPLSSFADEQPFETSAEETIAAPAFDGAQWAESQSEARGAGGRQVLGTALTVIAALWLAYTAWLAGRSLGAQPLSSPALAQWVAVAAGPLALLGLPAHLSAHLLHGLADSHLADSAGVVQRVPAGLRIRAEAVAGVDRAVGVHLPGRRNRVAHRAQHACAAGQ